MRPTGELHVPHNTMQRIRATVKPHAGQVPSFIFNSPEVYQLEIAQVYARCWLFVAHESEVPEPGDYVTRFMSQDPVIVARGEDGRVRVFLNVCRHRGMRLCRADIGNSSHFRCSYHGFTYRNTGELIGVPFQKEAYRDTMDKSEMALVEAHVDSYRGLIFAAWEPGIKKLEDYLGGMRWYLDLLVGRTEMEVVGPPHRWVVPTNWKLAAENFMSDSYHTPHTHASMVELGVAQGGYGFAKDGYHIHAGHGHGLGLTAPSPSPIFPAEVLRLFEPNLTRAQFDVLSKMKNIHATVFPNLSFLNAPPYRVPSAGGHEAAPHLTMRLWQPQGPDRCEVWSWLLVEKDAPEHWKELNRRSYVLTFGPSGMFEQDDAENWSYITANARGQASGQRISFHYKMGLDLQRISDFPGPGDVYQGKLNEANARAFYSRWLELLEEETT